MNNPIIVSVIMSVYNDEKYVSIAIDSILKQSFENFEFIIINDGSIDRTLEILKKYKGKDSRIVLINQENKGLTKSLNIGIEKAKGKYIARMDSDDISYPERLQKQIEFLENNEEYGLLGTNVEKIDKNENHIEFNTTKYTNEEIQKILCIRNCFAHGSVMINKELVSKDLYYDEEFRYAQDYRLWTKIAKKFKVANLDESLYKLRLHENSISKEKIEEQSTYAGIVAYEFENNGKVDNLELEIKTNKKLKEKIGKILLMNQQPRLAKKYFSIFSLYYFVSIVFQYINIYKLRRFFK
ncbi:glycosyl transferase family 2 [Arcobacter sp. CECT 8986]|uniref:glycosyltransferase family 2 protein n=1 Tax=Arcobacter sp. CECT 8986 TaxID=2044507 RepID=UPI001009971B|nr:glycosyltransferase [Arcobacter sp. CECT 8986]RXK00110.1 glycosyl transferase family 2 [Arcobacter sp. CECT 8986]